MSNIYEKELRYIKHIEHNTEQMSLKVWEFFDRSFTNKILKISKIIQESSGLINDDERAILIGYLEETGEFLKGIRESDRNDLVEGDTFVMSSPMHHLVSHCLRNDLYKILLIVDSGLEQVEGKPSKEVINNILKQIFEFINWLRLSTKKE